MKAILEFDLPSESWEFEQAQKGANYRFTLDDLDNWLRAKEKYEDLEMVKIDEVRAKIRELLA